MAAKLTRIQSRQQSDHRHLSRPLGGCRAQRGDALENSTGPAFFLITRMEVVLRKVLVYSSPRGIMSTTQNSLRLTKPKKYEDDRSGMSPAGRQDRYPIQLAGRIVAAVEES